MMEKNQVEDIELRRSPDGECHFNITLPPALGITDPLPHYYCLSKGRHSGNFYLKLGAAGKLLLIILKITN